MSAIRNWVSAKRAIVAVARKLAVLLHRLRASKQPYQPFFGQPETADMEGQ